MQIGPGSLALGPSLGTKRVRRRPSQGGAARYRHHIIEIIVILWLALSRRPSGAHRLRARGEPGGGRSVELDAAEVDPVYGQALRLDVFVCLFVCLF